MHLKPIDTLKPLVAVGLAAMLIGCGEQPAPVAEDGMQATEESVAEAPAPLPEAMNNPFFAEWDTPLSLIHISEPTRQPATSRMPSSA